MKYILRNGFYASIAQSEDTETPTSLHAIIDADTYSAAVVGLALHNQIIGAAVAGMGVLGRSGQA